MPKLRESVVFAVLATILISIPVASQNVQISRDGGIQGEIDSRFSDMFKVDFNPGEMILSLMNKNSHLEVNKSFRSKTVLFKTSKGVIRKRWTSNSITRTVETPYGSFKTRIENGENTTDFTGSNKAKTIEIREKLEERLERRMEEALDKKRVVVSRILPDIKLDAEADNRERFSLTNNGKKTVDLEGWSVVTEGGDGDSLQLEKKIEPGETLVFYSGDRKDIKGAEDAFYDTGLTIYNGDGSVKLFNENERVVDVYSY